jgi:hypothetical protein
MKKTLAIMILALMVLAVSSCEKENTKTANATLKNYTGMLDGCGWVIILDDGSKLEPVQFPEGTTLQDDARVYVEYDPFPTASICMVGITAKILKLRYL